MFLIREAIETAKVDATIDAVTDGEQAARYFDELNRNPSQPCPSLVLLDINLPKLKGTEVLRHLKQGLRSRNTCVIVVSTSIAPRDREETLRLGANAYFSKPSDYDAFLQLGTLVRQHLLGES